MIKKVKNRQIAMLFVLCYLLLVIFSCDLFTGPKVDLFKQISDEVDWAKASKLTVRVEHPALWGVSNPTGNITPAKDIRKGYAFVIEFTPDLAWSLDGWRAYATSSLPPDWVLDTSLLDSVERLDGVSVIVPELPARGGIGSFTINTTENVTLVPWCKTEPYILRTVPRNSPSTVYPRGTDIEIFFNAPLALAADVELPVLFSSEIIKITARNGVTGEVVPISNNNYSYNYPVYTANNDLGEYKITITPADAPGDCVIEVTVGPLIYNIAGNPMAKAEVFSFGTSPATGGGSIDTWDASYAGNTITVNWTTTGTVYVEARYRVNRSADINSSRSSPAIIGGVNALNASGVRDGVSVSGMQEYEVFLDLIVEGLKSNVGSVSFKIWNFPGMSVSLDNPVHEVKNDLELANLNLNDANVKYVLVNDITVNNHTPVGTSGNPFTGTFYGAGHTISIGGGFTVPSGGTADIGLFGVVDGGYIRDLTVDYKNVTITRSGETRFGGIAGTLSGMATMENVLVKGGISVTVDTDHNMEVGGIAGKMTGTASIQNAYGGLDLTVDHPNTNTTNNPYARTGTSVCIGGISGNMGGIAGVLYNDPIGNKVKVEKVTVTGNISVTAKAFLYAGDDDNRGLIAGGLVGQLIEAELIDSHYRRGNITVNLLYGSTSLGGAVGYSAVSNITNCSAMSRIFEIITDVCNYIVVGGFAGQLNFRGEVNNCYSDNPVTLRKLYNTDDSAVYIGGFVGWGSSNISYCYSKGDVSVQTPIYSIIGGFAGLVYGDGLKNCYASGNVSVLIPINDVNLSVGGFIGTSSAYSFTNCYSLGNVFVDSNGNNSVAVGGFVSNSNYDTKHNFSMGAVTVWNSTGSTTAGGFSAGLNAYYQNNVTLCASVTVTGSGTKYIGRVGGRVGSGSPSNYAYSDMTLSTRTSQGASWTSVTPSVGAATKDGANAHNINFRDPAFWKGLGFSENDWIFSTTVGMRHPILRASDGTEMGGQR